MTAIVAAVQPPAAEWPGGGRVVLASAAVYALEDGRPTADPASAGVAVSALTIAVEGDALRARVELANDLVADTTVAVVLAPPDGPRMRVVRLPDGSGFVEREDGGGAFQAVDRVEVVAAGRTVELPIPAAVGVRADWEAQIIVETRGAGGGGAWSATVPVPVGALTGQRAAGRVPAPRRGVAVRGGAPVAALAADLPDPARPVALEVGVAGDRLRATVRFAAPPEVLRTFDGKDVVTHVVALQVAPSFDRAARPLVYSYDLRTGQARLFDSSRTDADLGSVPVTVEGDAVTFDVGPAPPAPGSAPLTAGARASVTVLDAGNDGVTVETAFAQLATLLQPPPEPPEPTSVPTTTALAASAAPATTAPDTATGTAAAEDDADADADGDEVEDADDIADRNRTGAAARVALVLAAIVAGALLLRRRIRREEEEAVADAERRRR